MLVNIQFQELPLQIPTQAPWITLVHYHHLSFRRQLALVLSVICKLFGLLQVKAYGLKLCLCDDLSSFYSLVSIWAASFEMSMFLLQSKWPIQRHLGLTRAIRMSSCYVSLKGLLLEIFLGQKIFKIVNYIDVFRFTCFTSGSRKLIEAFYLVPNCRFKVQNAEINLPTQNADSSSKDMILHTNM